MDKANKDLLLNLTIVSFALSVLYSILITTTIDNSVMSLTPYASGPGDFVVFVLFFLILYPLQILLSALNFAAARLTGSSLPKQLILFNMVGLVIVGALYFFIQKVEVFCLIISLVVLSMITIVRE